MDFGFRPDGVATALVTLSHQRQGASAELSLLFWQEVLRDLEARGAHAAVATNPPVSGSSMQYGYAIQGEASQYWGQYHAVTAAYFAVLGTDLVAGRAFTDADGPAAAPVVIVNEQLARQHFPNEDAIGRTLQVVGTGRTIIGVARSTRHFGPDREPPAELYVPLAQDPSPFAHVLVRSNEGSAADVLADVIARIDAQVLVPPLLPFGNYISTWFAPLRLQVVILGVFGAVGAFLAALGIYALVAYVVSNGVREIGIRLALGERSEVVFRRVLGHGLTMTVIGAAAGIAVAAATRQVLRQFVRVDPIDPVVVLIVSGVVTMIALLASVLPACRAIRVDPIVTLRAE
jgi:putative ABC transport system permease protein